MAVLWYSGGRCPRAAEGLDLGSSFACHVPCQHGQVYYSLLGHQLPLFRKLRNRVRTHTSNFILWDMEYWFNNNNIINLLGKWARETKEKLRYLGWIQGGDTDPSSLVLSIFNQCWHLEWPQGKTQSFKVSNYYNKRNKPNKAMTEPCYFYLKE